MLEWLARLLGSGDHSKDSKDMAKERLRLVLVQDRALLSPGLLEKLKEDIVEVLSKYMEIDEQSLEVNLDSSDESVALVANIPVKSVKRRI
ncbi:MAG: cell division topological specificity factor MinE [Firmicutes bacterium]|nr:cell division topological specificity factor MinE [Bacillota bacterium]